MYNTDIARFTGHKISEFQGFNLNKECMRFHATVNLMGSKYLN